METVIAENIEKIEKSVNAIRAAEIYIYTSSDEADEAANLEDTASDKENSAAEKVAIVAKGETKSEATKASKTDTKVKRFKSVQCNFRSSFEKGLAQNLWMKQKSRCNARQYSLELLQVWKIFYNHGCQATSISKC